MLKERIVFRYEIGTFIKEGVRCPSINPCIKTYFEELIFTVFHLTTKSVLVVNSKNMIKNNTNSSLHLTDHRYFVHFRYIKSKEFLFC